MDMRHDQYHALLAAYDDPVFAGQPNGFDHQEAENAFIRFATGVLQEFEEATFETGGKIQDASFHGQVILAPFLIQGCHVYVGGDPLYMRASNFGGFITAYHIHCHGPLFEMSTPQQPDLSHIASLVGRWQYTYIPVDVLNEPYTGENPGVDGIRTWFHRYFDYI
jgi:hypothetical protein